MKSQTDQMCAEDDDPADVLKRLKWMKISSIEKQTKERNLICWVYEGESNRGVEIIIY